MTGVKSNIVTDVVVTPGTAHDSPILPRLLDETAKRFTMREISADKAYLSDPNLRHIERLGAYPYIPFKSNTTGNGSPMWRRLYGYFMLNEASWKEHYHKRSNVETTISMIKGKFGDSLQVQIRDGSGQRDLAEGPVPQHLRTHPGDARVRCDAKSCTKSLR